MTALDVLSAGAAESTIRRLAAAHGFDIRGHFGPVGGNRDRLLAGESCDLIVLTQSMIDDLIRSGHVAPGTRADLGRVATALAVPKGAPRPGVADEAGLREILLGASAIYIPDPANATAGAHFAKTLDALGLAKALAPRLRKAPSGAAAMAMLAASPDAKALGCTQVTEIKANAGVDLLAPLPGAFALISVYAAGIASHAATPEAARRFLALLSGPASRTIRAEAGFEI